MQLERATLPSEIYRRLRSMILDGGLKPGETTLEATYGLGVTGHLSVQPDLQYVISPSGAPGLANALAAGSRIIVNW